MAYYRYHVFLCTNLRDNGRQCCALSGASAARDFLKARAKELGLSGSGGIRVNAAGCLGRCAEGPTLVVYPDGVWYSYVDNEDLEEILQEHLIKGRAVGRLQLSG
ncbi:(2Fe-2S) ferredoxin domain-containing protein [Thiorhodococcus mannitoliphagus]|uniref:(2Fe-2S) ferredoxin domain-containing protein n=1 Tax=Thiorhodococcus mannitoliphagus TaxID=329406 RepID=A0A6P1DW98_9GAMM|nr:(2Fe-2S) ferredoxin domain-containing protein [Thiorhodococcus mannitoliphagus]NEX21291.1 (2Fe-2S) ferredoxin domain-containing protein [Thiorhodococcus mannitoliphagus]